MSVYRPKKSAYYQYDFWISGHRFHGSTGKTTRREAERFEKKKRAEVLSKMQEDGRIEMTIGEASQLYWEHKGQHQASAENNDYQIVNINRILGGDTLLSSTDDGTVARFVSIRRGERSRNAFKGHGEACRCQGCLISVSSVNRETQLFRRIVRYAGKVGRAHCNEIDWGEHMLTEPAPPDRPLTDDQEERLFAELVSHAVPIVEFALITGVRKENDIALDWADINLSGREIRFRTKSDKPDGEPNVMPIEDDLLFLLLSLGPKEEGPVFTFGPPCDCSVCKKAVNHGRPIKSIRTTFKAACKRAGFPEFRFHDLRHTVGARILASGYDLSAAQKYLMHKDIATTVRYAHHAHGIKSDIQGAISRRKSRTIPEPRLAESKNAS